MYQKVITDVDDETNHVEYGDRRWKLKVEEEGGDRG
jgi:hypothetical protein